MVLVCSKCKREISPPFHSFNLCRSCFKDRVQDINKIYDPKKGTIFQTYIYEKIKASCNDTDIMTYKQLRDLLVNSHIPLSMHTYFIKEILDLKMINKINSNTFKVRF